MGKTRIITSAITVISMTLTMAVSGCGSRRSPSVITYNQGNTAIPPPRAEPEMQAHSLSRVSPQDQATSAQAQVVLAESQKNPSLDAAAASRVQDEITDRKIIRSAEITIETGDPGAGLQKIASIAEKNGGFVVTSESKESNNASRTVTVVARVPAPQFDAAIEAIRRLDGKIKAEKISGEDVTEEYIDLEARIHTKRALELQFIEIMKQARKISEALEVQGQLAEVRTEIERLEGRRRFLANKSALSTISITLQTPAPLIVASTSGFGESFKTAFSDGLDTAAEIVLDIIRFVLGMIPIALFILLPGWVLYRRLRRYFPWRKSAAHTIGVTDQAAEAATAAKAD